MKKIFILSMLIIFSTIVHSYELKSFNIFNYKEKALQNILPIESFAVSWKKSGGFSRPKFFDTDKIDYEDRGEQRLSEINKDKNLYLRLYS